MRALAALLAAACLAGADAPAAKPSLDTVIDGEVLHANTVSYLGLSLTDVTATPRLDDGVLVLDPCRGSAYGGEVSARVAIDLAHDRHTIHLEVRNLDLGTFLRQYASYDDGTRGKLDGQFDLSLPGDADRATGSGEITVHDGNLLQLGPLANLLIGDPTKGGGQDHAEARLELANGVIRLKGASIRSPAALVKLRGTIALDGSLRLVVIPYAEFGTFKFIPGLGDIAAWLLSNVSSRIARATIRGYLGQPVVSLNPFAD